MISLVEWLEIMARQKTGESQSTKVNKGGKLEEKGSLSKVLSSLLIGTVSATALASGATAMPKAEILDKAAPKSAASETTEALKKAKSSLPILKSAASETTETLKKAKSSLPIELWLTDIEENKAATVENSKKSPEPLIVESASAEIYSKSKLEIGSDRQRKNHVLEAANQTGDRWQDIHPLIVANPPETAPLENQTIANPFSAELDPSLNQEIDGSNSESATMEQVTSVSELSDVQPTDWAFSALQNLVERYNCIAGYPDGTFRGNRAMTRYEFAAGLNACADTITQLLGQQGDTSKFVTKEDLAILQRLVEEFQVELATVSGRVDILDARAAELESNQFSTTTKLFGYVTFSLQDIVSGEGATEAVLQQQTYFNLLTSFTGRDLMSIGILAKNIQSPNLATTNNGREVGSTLEGTTNWAFGINTSNVVINTFLEYVFPVIEGKQKLYVTLAASNGFNTSRFLLPLSPLTWEGYELGSGPISAFGQRNPIYRLGGGAGVLVNYDTGGPWRLNAIYLATQGNDSSPGAGIFNGDYAAVGQVNYTSPDNKLALALIYMNHYFSPGRYAYNSQSKLDAEGPGFIGTALANRFDNAGVLFDENVPVVSNTYGIQAFYRFSPKFIVGGFAAKTNARPIGRGDASIWTYSLSLAFPDLGKKGNLGGVIVGVEPTLTGFRVGGKYVGSFKNDTSLHIEAFYRYQLTDNLSITPGVIWITAPNQDADNEDIVNAILRATFTF